MNPPKKELICVAAASPSATWCCFWWRPSASRPWFSCQCSSWPTRVTNACSSLASAARPSSTGIPSGATSSRTDIASQLREVILKTHFSSFFIVVHETFPFTGTWPNNVCGSTFLNHKKLGDLLIFRGSYFVHISLHYPVLIHTLEGWSMVLPNQINVKAQMIDSSKCIQKLKVILGNFP